MYQNINVVIVEDDLVTREVFQNLIDDADGISVQNTYASAEDAFKGITRDDPDVILLDVGLPGINGVEAIGRLKKLVPQAHVIILTVFEMENLVFDALCNGASGYLVKDVSSTAIISSILEVEQGGAVMSPGIARMVIDTFRKNPISPLSKREGQVLELISLGKSRRCIAKELFIETGTVKTHIKNIYFKLDVNSKEEALKTAREKKLI